MEKKRYIIAGNWKMNKNNSETEEFIRQIANFLEGKEIKRSDIIISPPFTSLYTASKLLEELNLKIYLSAQNLYPKENGAYTGEISPIMLKELKCDYCIIGHSERRKYFKETDEFINEKIAAALSHNIKPILCVGESLEDREKGKMFDVVREQIREGLKGIQETDIKSVIIAYEPVWAIGTGKNATPEQAQEVHSYIRKLLTDIYSESTAKNVKIIYGGSVKSKNIQSLLSEKDIDGALIGGASLKIEEWSKIIELVETL